MNRSRITRRLRIPVSRAPPSWARPLCSTARARPIATAIASSIGGVSSRSRSAALQRSSRERSTSVVHDRSARPLRRRARRERRSQRQHARARRLQHRQRHAGREGAPGSRQSTRRAFELDGTASIDPDGDVLSYAWRVTGGPAGSIARLSTADLPTATFTPDLAGEYAIELIVSDGRHDSAPVSVKVSTSAAMPVADAGSDRAARSARPSCWTGRVPGRAAHRWPIRGPCSMRPKEAQRVSRLTTRRIRACGPTGPESTSRSSPSERDRNERTRCRRDRCDGGWSGDDCRGQRFTRRRR